MVLKSYSFEEDFDMNIWGLFEGEKKLGARLNYAFEIAEAARKGKIDFEHKFELEKYINEINRREKLESLREAKRLMPIVDNSDGEGDASGGMSDRQMHLADASDAYRKLLDDCELQYAVEMMNSLNSHYIVEAQCDFRVAVRQALKGIPDSIKIVKEMCEEYPAAADLLKIILGSGHSYESLFPDVK